MKDIIVKKDNRDRIQAAIEAIQGRSSSRIISAEDVFEICQEIEKKMRISKKALEGCSFFVDVHAQDFPNAYKWTPFSTWVQVIRKNGNWKLIDIRREETARFGRGYCSDLTQEAKNAILDNYISF